MIEARDAIRAARALIGTPYGVLDCIGLVVRIIRTTPGGEPGYRTAGTNPLWRSYDSAPKYKDLTWRQEGLSGARAGMLAFKRRGEDIHHVGLVTGEGTVIHASSAKGCVVETALGSTWQLLARHRYIGTSPGPSGHPPQRGGLLEEESMATLYKAMVTTDRDPLRVREAPETGRIIGHVPRGRTVDVLTGGEWPRIRYGETVGYASGDYLTRVSVVDDGVEDSGWMSGDEIEAEASVPKTTSLVREDGTVIVLAGIWRVASD